MWNILWLKIGLKIFKFNVCIRIGISSTYDNECILLHVVSIHTRVNYLLAGPLFVLRPNTEHWFVKYLLVYRKCKLGKAGEVSS